MILILYMKLYCLITIKEKPMARGLLPWVKEILASIHSVYRYFRAQQVCLLVFHLIVDEVN